MESMAIRRIANSATTPIIIQSGSIPFAVCALVVVVSAGLVVVVVVVWLEVVVGWLCVVVVVCLLDCVLAPLCVDCPLCELLVFCARACAARGARIRPKASSIAAQKFIARVVFIS